MTETRGDDLAPTATDTLRAAALRLRVGVFEERREHERLVRKGEEMELPPVMTRRRWAINLAVADFLERWVTLAMLADSHGPYGEPDLQHALTVAKAVLGTS